MGRRTLQASEQGIAILRKAIKRKEGGQTYLAGAVGCSRQTIASLLKGNSIDCETFMSVCQELGLNWEDIAQPETSEPESNAAINVLVETVRQKVRANIKKRCGEMRVLDMTRPIDLDTIYTDVNILQEITGRQRLDLAQLLERCSLADFDRIGFSQARSERRSGLEAVQEFDKLMLLGKPGAGKTTFLKRLAMLCNEGKFQQDRVPVFITLKDFGDSSANLSLLAYIGQWLKEVAGQTAGLAEQLLSQGRCLLLLDGLDEVSESSGKQVLQEIKSVSERFSENAFIVSCRIAAKEFTFQQFTEVEAADFDDEQIADFATRWFAGKQLVEKTKKFLENLKEHPRIRELATNPLLLTLLCLTFEGRTNFPANRSELYKEGLDVLLKKWDGSRSIEREQVYRELSLKRKEDLLSQLAFTTFESENYFFKQKEAERLIEAYIKNLPGADTDPEALRLDSEAVLKSIESQHGLLVERARGIYSFSHLTFHEYFTARELESQEYLNQTLVSHLTEKRWREVFLLTIGMLKKADSLLLAMKSQIDGMLVNDDKLQRFLTWGQNKASSVSSPYKPAAIRAFYFALDRDLDLDLDLDLALALALDLALALALDLALGRDQALDLDRDLAFDLALNLDRDLALDLDRDLDRDLALALDLARVRTLDLDRDLALALDRDRALTLALALDRALDRALDPSLKNSLQVLKDQLPNPREDWEHRQIWWRTNGATWFSQLRAVVIEHRNIGHDWQFSDAQKELLNQYYEANKLLVACLNSDCYVSREVRQEIEDNLLLPISEIEHNCSNQPI